MLPPDAGAKRDTAVYDPLPPDSGARDVGRDGQTPIDGGYADAEVRDTAKEGPWIVDPPPPPTDARDVRLIEVDPLPPPSDARDGANERPLMVDPVVDARWGVSAPEEGEAAREGAAREHWADTAPSRIKRSQDLPLYLCPEVRVAGEWVGDKVRACLSGVEGDFSVRWQSQGQVEGEGGLALWTPSSDEDQLNVAIRTHEGVSVTLLRLGQVRGRRSA
jgi:hypothetical protein